MLLLFCSYVVTEEISSSLLVEEKRRSGYDEREGKKIVV